MAFEIFVIGSFITFFFSIYLELRIMILKKLYPLWLIITLGIFHFLLFVLILTGIINNSNVMTLISSLTMVFHVIAVFLMVMIKQYYERKNFDDIHLETKIIFGALFLSLFYVSYYSRSYELQDIMSFSDVADVSIKMILTLFLLFLLLYSYAIFFFVIMSSNVYKKNPLYTLPKRFQLYIMTFSYFFSLIAIAQINITDPDVLMIFNRTFDILLFASSAFLVPTFYSVIQSIKKQP